MKRLFLIYFILIYSSFAMSAALANNSEDVPATYTAAQQPRDVVVFAENNYFGLKDKNGNIVVPAIYKKMIMTGKSGWIVQKKSKYGIMDSNGQFLIQPKYRYADRILGRYIKLGNYNDFGIYNEYGEIIIPPEYRLIELLYGRMFLTYKNFRYGVSDFKGNVLIPNICEEIYMPSKNTMKIKYQGEWYEINNIRTEEISITKFSKEGEFEKELNLKNILSNTGTISGYSVLTFSDYLIKVFSSVSPAHEETIDDLILSHGVDTIDILKTFSWVPKYPLTFGRKYFEHFQNPYSGILSDSRNKLIRKRN